MNGDVPDRLHRKGRPEDQKFAPEERLFRAIAARRDISPEGRLLPSAVPFPDASFNREKYSEPRDVLIGREKRFGVAAVAVGDIPAEIEHPDTGKTLAFRPVHAPVDASYSHTELRAFEDGVHLTRKPSRLIRKRFRLLMFRKIAVLVEPE